MEWLNVHIAKQLRSPEAIGSSPAELGTWVRVLAYCCEQENGGRIVGGAAWKDRQWQQVCAVTLRELRAADRLIRIDGNDVIVNGYPTEKEAEVQRARGRGRAGALSRWGKRSTCSSNAQAHAQASARAYAEGEGEGEGEGESEGELREHAPASESDPADICAQQLNASRSTPLPPDPKRQENSFDLTNAFPLVLVRREELGRMDQLICLWSWKLICEAAKALSAEAKDGCRVWPDQINRWLAARYKPDPEDYRRAGIPHPEAEAS